jgi:hypothetical protein
MYPWSQVPCLDRHPLGHPGYGSCLWRPNLFSFKILALRLVLMQTLLPLNAALYMNPYLHMPNSHRVLLMDSAISKQMRAFLEHMSMLMVMKQFWGRLFIVVMKNGPRCLILVSLVKPPRPLTFMLHHSQSNLLVLAMFTVTEMVCNPVASTLSMVGAR